MYVYMCVCELACASECMCMCVLCILNNCLRDNIIIQIKGMLKFINIIDKIKKRIVVSNILTADIS